jgi:hypothetical protein
MSAGKLDISVSDVGFSPQAANEILDNSIFKGYYLHRSVQSVSPSLRVSTLGNC